MIWFDRQNLPFFADQKLTQATIAGRSHQVFIDPDHDGADGKWTFIALLPDNLPARGELPLADPIDQLLKAGALRPEGLLPLLRSVAKSPREPVR
jgi:hypothetical protein